MKIKALVIDDEPHAREGIILRLKKYETIEVIGECSSGDVAVESVNLQKPDLIFLDIQMPGKNGFEVLQSISPDSLPLVIFVTAYDKHAIRAFEFHAIDYLLKPIDDERFDKAVNYAIALYEQQVPESYSSKLKEVIEFYDRISISSATAENDLIDRIPIKSKNSVRFIQISEIQWIESAGDYVYIHSDSKKHLLRETLSVLEKRLKKAGFVRIHRSTIVNIEKIDSLRSADHGDYTVFLTDGTKLKLSRNYKPVFDKVIGYSL